MVEQFVAAEVAGQLLHTASVTKFVLSTAVAAATRLRILPDLDESIAVLLTEWIGTDKELITLRQLMNHTSGLAVSWPPPASQDTVRFALHRKPEVPAGTRWCYDNHGASLIAEALQRASGVKLDVWVDQHLLQPLGIGQYRWNRDVAGNPYAMSALQLTAADLARFGRLWLQDGAWEGDRLLESGWLSTATGPSIEGIEGVGLLCSFVPGEAGPVLVGHDGSGGQHLWLLPEADVVVARLRSMDLADPDPAPDLPRALASIATSISR